MIVAIFVMLIGHLTVFTLGIIGTGINSLRLQYVEFLQNLCRVGARFTVLSVTYESIQEKEVTP